MLLRLLLLFTLLPLAELFILLWLSRWTSVWWTIGLVVATGVLGAWLARREGWRAVKRIRDRLRAGEMPGDALLDGLLILIAGAVLVTPGILTDLAGFSLLTSPVRRRVGEWIRKRFAARFQVSGGWTQSHVVDSHFVQPSDADDLIEH